MTIVKKKETLKWILDNIAWFILLSMLIVFSFTVRGFAQWPIFRNILYHSVFVGILAIGEAICVLSKEIDLSVESVLALSAVVTAYLAGIGPDASGLHLNGITTLAIVLVMGAMIGLFNSYFVVKMKISSFIVTLAGYLIFRAVGLVLTRGHGIVNISKDIVAIARTNIGPIPLMIIILIFMYVIFSFFLSRVQFGRFIYFVGDSREASYNAGIKVDKVLIAVFIISGVLSAFAGWLLAARTNGSSPSLGQGILFEAMAAVVIGGVSLQGGVGRLSGVFAGAIILSCISTVISIAGMDPYYMNIIRGGMIIIAVLLDAIIRKVRPKLI